MFGVSHCSASLGKFITGCCKGSSDQLSKLRSRESNADSSPLNREQALYPCRAVGRVLGNCTSYVMWLWEGLWPFHPWGSVTGNAGSRGLKMVASSCLPKWELCPSPVGVGLSQSRDLFHWTKSPDTAKCLSALCRCGSIGSNKSNHVSLLGNSGLHLWVGRKSLPQVGSASWIGRSSNIQREARIFPA